MSRIRTVKPELFEHEGLYEAEQETGLPLRLAFIGLFCQCDREGRFEWRPARLKLHILPWDSIDFSRVLHALTTRGFLVHYASGGREFGAIPSWRRHQVINNRERESELPKPEDCQQVTDACPTRAPRDTEMHVHAQGEGEREGEGEQEKTPPLPPSGGNGSKRTRFVPPTIDEVRAYCRERGNSVDPQAWIDHYTANGWKVGRNPMKDWKAAVRTWEKGRGGADEARPGYSPEVGYYR